MGKQVIRQIKLIIPRYMETTAALYADSVRGNSDLIEIK